MASGENIFNNEGFGVVRILTVAMFKKLWVIRLLWHAVTHFITFFRRYNGIVP